MCEPMLKIKDVMCKKVVTCKEDISIQSAIELLQDRHVGSIIVIDEEEHIKGIFTERDAIRIVAAKYASVEPLS